MNSRIQAQSCEGTDRLIGSVPSRNLRGTEGAKSMKRVVVGRYGGPEVLQVVEEEDPRPGPGEVCARVLVAGVSFSDALLRRRCVSRRPEAALHARLRACRRRRGARPGLFEAR